MGAAVLIKVFPVKVLELCVIDRLSDCWKVVRHEPTPNAKNAARKTPGQAHFDSDVAVSSGSGVARAALAASQQSLQGSCQPRRCGSSLELQ
jgi:hypothetical protein